VSTPEYGSQFLEILRRQVRGQTLGHHDCVTAHFDAFGCNRACCSLGRWAGRALCRFSCPDLVRRARRCRFIDTCWFHWRVGRDGIGHGAPRWRKDSWIALPNHSRGAGRGTLPRDAAPCPAPDTGRPGQLMSLLVFNAGSSTLEFGLIDAGAALRQNGARRRVGSSDPT
jgi:hypothetical protein